MDAVPHYWRRRVVIYWPMGTGVEKRGPWAHWGRLLKAAGGERRAARGPGLGGRAPAAIEAAGGEVLFSHPLKYRIECRARCVEINCNALHAIDAMLAP